MAAARIPLLPANLSDRLLQALARILPEHLPPRMRQYRERFEHHLILKVSEASTPSMRRLLSEILPSQSGAVFECTDAEAEIAFLHRFGGWRGRALQGRSPTRC
jgi:D-lactate dehydrogenase